MQKYHSPYTVYSMPENSLIGDLRSCSMAYLSLYLEMLSQAEKIQDPDYRQHVAHMHKTYTEDLLTHDNSRKMLGKIIGTKRADRIFHEAIV